MYVSIGHDHYGKHGHRTLGSLPHMFGLMARAPFNRNLPKMWFEPMGKRAAVEILSGLLEAGKLTPVVTKTFSLAEVPVAIRALHEGQFCGKIIVVP